MSDLLEYALQYAGRGWHVFPCKPRDKTPLTRTGFKSATTDPKQIHRWWSKWPDANIGIATGEKSGLLVVDIDSAQGIGALREIVGCALASTPVVETGRGWHLYFAMPAERLRCSSDKARGLDIRANGGYVLAPPSVHPTGAVYRWRA